jgi:hypothetical protein
MVPSAHEVGARARGHPAHTCPGAPSCACPAAPGLRPDVCCEATSQSVFEILHCNASSNRKLHAPFLHPPKVMHVVMVFRSSGWHPQSLAGAPTDGWRPFHYALRRLVPLGGGILLPCMPPTRSRPFVKRLHSEFWSAPSSETLRQPYPRNGRHPRYVLFCCTGQVLGC